MKRMILGTIAIAIFVLFGGFLIANDAFASKYKIKMGSTSVRSGLYAVSVALAKIINKAYPDEIEVTVVETGGYIENLARLNNNFVQMAPSNSAAAYAAYKGIIDFEGREMPKLRSLWGGYVTPIHILTSGKSGVTSIEGINGLPFAMAPGMTSGRMVELLFKANAIKPDYKFMGVGASVDAMKSGGVQGWFKAGFKDAAILDLMAVMKINILPITPEMINNINKKYPAHGLSMTIPVGTFESVKKPQLSFAYVLNDYVNKDMPADVVYKILKAVWSNRVKLAQSHPSLKEGDFDKMYEMAIKYDLSVPFHPGAVKFYREVLKVKIPDKLIPPEMK